MSAPHDDLPDDAPPGDARPAARDGDAADAAALDRRVDHDLLRLHAESLPEGLLMGLAVLALAAALLQLLAQPSRLWPWVAAVATMLLLGLWLAARCRHGLADQPASLATWRRRIAAYSVVVALTWSAGAWLFLPGPWEVELLLCTVLAGLAVSIIGHTAAPSSVHLGFLAGLLLPLAVRMAASGGELQLGLAAGVLLLMAALARLARRGAQALRQSLRVGHENRRLAHALAARTREAELANAARTRFFAAASHDLRQPVQALGLLLDVLEGQVQGAPQRQSVQRAQRVLQSLETLFGSLLDLSRLDTGVVRPRPEPVALRPLVEALADEFALPAAEKGLALRLRAAEAWTRSDPALLERVLRNLLANALRYTAKGGVLLACRARAGGWAIEVWDSGVGIAAHHQDAVFEEFYQVGNAQRARSEGLGLGLAIVRRLTKLLGHGVELRSRAGRGSLFRVLVPRVAAGSAEAARVAPATLAGLRPRHVLVVEDDVDVREALVAWLEAWGLQVTACADARGWRRRWAPGPATPDLLIVDGRLPGPDDGLAVVAQVRERLGRCLPALLVTGDAGIDRCRTDALPALVLLHKPVQPAALRAALQAAMVTRQPADGQRALDSGGTTGGRR